MCAVPADRHAVAADPVAGDRQQQRGDPERAQIGRVDEQAREEAGARAVDRAPQERDPHQRQQDDGEPEDLPGLDKRERLEQLVSRSEPAGEDDEPFGSFHEHGLARIEVVKGQRDVEIRVRALLVR